MMEFSKLVTVKDGYLIDDELITETDDRYSLIVEHIAQNDSGAAQSRAKELEKDYLAGTDWLVVRELETGKKVPLEVTNKRAAARLTISGE